MYLTTDREVWIRMLKGKLAVSDAILKSSGAVKLNGKVTEFGKWLRMFEPLPDGKVKRLPFKVPEV